MNNPMSPHTKSLEELREEWNKKFVITFSDERIRPNLMIAESLDEIPNWWLSKFSSLLEKERTRLMEEVEKVCDEETMDRIWKSDKQAKYIAPNYEPHCATFSVNTPYDKKYGEMIADEIRCEMYECGFVRGETWGAQKIKRALVELLNKSS
jgi:hypothetical protein